MKRLTLSLILLVILAIACKESEIFEDMDPDSELLLSPESETPSTTNNYDLLASALRYMGWSTADELYTLVGNDENVRNTFISIFESKIKDSTSVIQGLPSNLELAGNGLCYDFLLKAGLRTVTQLEDMTLDSLRNSAIAYAAQEAYDDPGNTQTLAEITTELQTKGTLEVAQIAYRWWLPGNTDFSNLLSKIANVSGSTTKYFDLEDTAGVNIDVLRMEVTNDTAYDYIGVYHKLDSGHFNLYLAGSDNLEDWVNLGILVENGHQGDIKKFDTGYVVAYEKTVNSGSNKLGLSYYESLSDLIAKTASRSTIMDRNHGQGAEGTPDIRSITGSNIDHSTIVLGFHYYTGNTDRLAFGILKNFNCSMWKSWKDELSDFNIQKLAYDHSDNGNNTSTACSGIGINTTIPRNYEGKIGGRKSFTYNGNTYTLQEAQGMRYDTNDNHACVWESWRLLLGDGAYYYEVDMTTPAGSFSFANPGITKVGSDHVITTFMPSENGTSEAGDLLYKVTF